LQERYDEAAEMYLEALGLEHRNLSQKLWRRTLKVFGPKIAADLHKRRPKPYTTWHLDEVYLKIDGHMVCRKGKREFPICSLGNRPKGDVNGNIDPLFAIIGWSDSGNFRELFPPPVDVIEPPKTEALPAPVRLKQRAADIVDDDIPFAWVAAFLVPLAAMVASHVA
jgi:hypothetical protein